MNNQDNSRIRLKVVTTAGINILCTALKTQKVAEWLPHFQQAYRQVKEEQGDDAGSKSRFIRALRIKKDDYHIANSQIIGDVFQDNDQVFCEILFPQSKRQSKADKVQQKQQEHKSHKEVQPSKTDSNINQEEQGGHAEENEQDKEKIVKKEKSRKKVKSQVHTQSPTKVTSQKIDKKSVKDVKSVSEKSQTLKKVDIGKLKNLLIRQESSSGAKQGYGSQGSKKKHLV